MMKSFEQSKKAEKSLQGIAKPQRPEAQPSATVELAVDGDVEGVEECGPTIPSDGTPRDREKALAKLGTRRRGRNGVGKKPAMYVRRTRDLFRMVCFVCLNFIPFFSQSC